MGFDLPPNQGRCGCCRRCRHRGRLTPAPAVAPALPKCLRPPPRLSRPMTPRPLPRRRSRKRHRHLRRRFRGFRGHTRCHQEAAACAPRLPDDGGDGDKTPLGAHATAGREESGRSSVAGELRGLAALLPSARSERSNGQAAMPMLLAATNGAIVSVRRSKVGCAWAVEGSRPPLAKERSGESDSL